MTNEITTVKELLESLYAAQHELAKVKQELKEIKDQKDKRALSYKRNSNVSSEEKTFGKTLRAANRSYKSQVYKNVATLRRTILQKIKPNDEWMFFAIFISRVNSIKGIEAFASFCKKNKLNIDAVAQHVVIRGDKAMNIVFKNGVSSVFSPEQLDRMTKVVFSEQDLDLTKYEDENEKVNEPEEVGNN